MAVHKCLFLTSLTLLAACGGGGGAGNTGSSSSTSSGNLNSSGPTATVTSGDGSKFPWNISTTPTVLLKDSAGNTIPNTGITCTAVEPANMEVANDCSSVKPKRLGNQSISVTNGTIAATATIKVIPQRQPFSQGIAATEYSLAVTPTGNVLAWGNGTNGQLGQNSLTPAASSLPLLVKNQSGSSNLSNIVSSSSGYHTAYALTEDGTVLGWGSYEEGMLTAATTDTALTPANLPNAANNGNLAGIVQISGGRSAVAALADDGTVFSWGFNNGQGTVNFLAHYPAQVKNPSGTGPLRNIVAISSSEGYTLALSSDGKVYGWGTSNYSILPQDNSEYALPVTIKRASDGTDLTGIVAISAGIDVALALTEDGHVYAWGENVYGQLGQGVSSLNQKQAVLVKDAAGTGLLSDVVMVSAGYAYSLALSSDGSVYAWGVDKSALGFGPNDPLANAFLPRSVVSTTALGSLSGVVAINAKMDSAFALLENGAMVSWGDTFNGQLGQDGPTDLYSDQPTPTPVKNPDGLSNLVFTDLSKYPNLFNHAN